MDTDGRDRDAERDVPMSPGAGGFPAGNPKPAWDPGRVRKSPEFPKFQRRWRWAQPRFQRIPYRDEGGDLGCHPALQGMTPGAGRHPWICSQYSQFGCAGIGQSHPGMLQDTLSPRPPPGMSPPLPAALGAAVARMVWLEKVFPREELPLIQSSWHLAEPWQPRVTPAHGGSVGQGKTWNFGSLPAGI